MKSFWQRKTREKERKKERKQERERRREPQKQDFEETERLKEEAKVVREGGAKELHVFSVFALRSAAKGTGNRILLLRVGLLCGVGPTP